MNLSATELGARASQLLAALDTTVVEPEQRASIAGALLDLLSDASFGRVPVQGRSLRRAMVEYVLRIGYPWALHLEADDLALVRSEVRAVARAERRVAVAVGFVAALAAAAVVALWPRASSSSQPTAEVARIGGPSPRTIIEPRMTDSAALAEGEAVASMGAKLRAQGDLVGARVWAEACALAAQEPRPCLLELRELASEKAAQTDHPRDIERLRAIDAQVQSNDVEALRRDAASWLETAFLVPVAAAPPDPEFSGDFVEQAVEFASLEASNRDDELVLRARMCMNTSGQRGVLCRSVAGQVLFRSPTTWRPARRALSAVEQVIVTQMTDDFAFDRLDRALESARSCERAIHPEPCATFLELVSQRRTVRGHSDSGRDRAGSRRPVR